MIQTRATIVDTLLKPLTSLNKVIAHPMLVYHRQQHALRLSRQIPDLKQGIASFYDESSGLWESMW